MPTLNHEFDYDEKVVLKSNPSVALIVKSVGSNGIYTTYGLKMPSGDVITYEADQIKKYVP